MNAGKEVTVSKTNVTVDTWTGAGYVILDPNTGAGAYMISGGQSGSFLMAMLLLVTGLLMLAIAVAAGPIVAAVVFLLMPIFLTFLAWLATEASEETRDCIRSIAISVGLIMRMVAIVTLNPLSVVRLTITINGAINRIGRDCFGAGIAY